MVLNKDYSVAQTSSSTPGCFWLSTIKLQVLTLCHCSAKTRNNRLLGLRTGSPSYKDHKNIHNFATVYGWYLFCYVFTLTVTHSGQVSLYKSLMGGVWSLRRLISSAPAALYRLVADSLSLCPDFHNVESAIPAQAVCTLHIMT